jgi:alpha-ketoglutarate-dependent taurine dioxygenase
MLASRLSDQRCWTHDTISPTDWLIPLPEAAVAEVEDVVLALRKDPFPVLLLSPGQFPFAECARVMRTAARQLREGTGIALIDRIPVERFTLEENRAVAWLLGSLLGRLVAQKWDGTMIYDVRDTGKSLAYGVRRSVTNLELLFHTDAPWLPLPPELVGLVCVNSARQGGVSRMVSLITVHHELQRRHPDLLPRLYRAFPWDRQAEHAPDDEKVAWQPVFQRGGQGLLARYNEALILNGEALAGCALDGEGREALAAMREIAEAPTCRVEFTIDRGQIQYLNNHGLAHSRTAFEDWEDAPLKRHLIRLWNRDEGRPTFQG